MRHRSAILTVLAGLLVASTAFSTVFAGTQSSPDISDATGDWQVEPDPTGTGNETSTPVAESIDITGVWWQFTSASNLRIGVSVQNLAEQNTTGQDTGSLTYSFDFTFSRPALPGASAANQSVTAEIGTNLNPDHTPSCDGGDNASKFPGENYLICNIPSSSVAPEYEGNTTFFDGDAITAGSLSSQGQTDDGTFTYTDSASGIQADIVADGVQDAPTGTDGDDGGGDDDGGNGDDGGGEDGGDGESTPGFGPVVAAASLVGVALWAARRRD